MNRFYIPTELDIKAEQFSEMYFEDMRLAMGSIVEKYLWLTYTTGERVYSLPDDWYFQLDANNYSYAVGELDDAAGQTDHKARTVTIAPEHKDDDIMLLHEMIHVFIGLYDRADSFTNLFGETIHGSVFPFIRDALLLCLHNDLNAKIPDLDERILAHANIHSGVAIAKEGGSHDILFFLKSLDLDLRCGYKLGTVCGYGRDEHFPDEIGSQKDATRQMGIISAAIEKSNGGRPSENLSAARTSLSKSEVLDEAGIDRRRANEAEKLAELPEE